MGGRYTHPDAEVIAATVAGKPDSLGGIRMAIRVAELARAGLTPDWMPGAVPRCVPTLVKRNQHGVHVGTVVVGSERIQTCDPRPDGARHLESHRHPCLPGHLAAASGTDRIRPARL